MELISSLGLVEATRGFDVEWLLNAAFRFPSQLKPNVITSVHDAVTNEQL